ncbi:hypothetical protein CSKR_101898 [Clonorchis sinensis]|uniref:Uncharacterized protein n=1 Tax=Clonorchis sinensis TaxID=79923 RepID=A0A8T1MI08_CLOSI|nr:hypothetical protein CSKR_101898 [Clonorchis sinensis]
MKANSLRSGSHNAHVVNVKSIEGEKLEFFVYQRLVSPQPSEDNNHYCSHLKSLNPGVWSDHTFIDCSVGAVTGEILRYTVTLDEDKLKPEYLDSDVEVLSWYVSKLLSGTENGCETTAEFTYRDFTSDAHELQITGVYDTNFCDSVSQNSRMHSLIRQGSVSLDNHCRR